MVFHLRNIILMLAMLSAGLFTPQSVVAQIETDTNEGTVTYQNPQNIYVRFTSTDFLKSGDTLFINRDGVRTPAAIVNHLSSISCVATPLEGVTIATGETIVAIRRAVIENSQPIETDSIPVVIVPPPPVLLPEADAEVNETAPIQQSIRGRLSASWYSNYYSNESLGTSNKMRYIFALNAQNIGGSKVSAETYISFRHDLNNWQEVENNFGRAFKVYSLAVTYDPTPTLQMTLGRRFNHYITNIGAIDGLQMQKSFRKFTVGGVVGSRPDYSTYGYNPELTQFGVFGSFETETGEGNTQTSLALFQQFNQWNTDRRFAYIQHSNSAIRNLYIFTSFEFDLFENIGGNPKNTFNLTSAYISFRYRASRKVMLFASYDARNNVIYYESYKSYLDQLIDQETRQGLRLRVNLRPWKYVSIGATAGHRLKASTQGPSSNFNVYINHSRIPLINVSASLSYIYLRSSYLRGNIFGIRLYRDIIAGKLFGEMQYRNVGYEYSTTSSKLKQNIFSGSISWRIYKKLSLSLYYEGIIDDRNKNNRFHLNVTQRF